MKLKAPNVPSRELQKRPEPVPFWKQYDRIRRIRDIEPLLMHRPSSARSFIYSVGTAVSCAGGKQTADLQAHDASNITQQMTPAECPGTLLASRTHFSSP